LENFALDGGEFLLERRLSLVFGMDAEMERSDVLGAGGLQGVAEAADQFSMATPFVRPRPGR
jgi:hypothetical protein